MLPIWRSALSDGMSDILQSYYEWSIHTAEIMKLIPDFDSKISCTMFANDNEKRQYMLARSIFKYMEDVEDTCLIGETDCSSVNDIFVKVYENFTLINIAE